MCGAASERDLALQHRLRLLAVLALLAGCKTDYSPDTYATRAVQQANRVEQGMVVGRREVQVTAEGSTGAAAGAAAGGVLGAQTPGGGIGAALGGVGGALIGGLIGTAAEHTVVDTKAFEYIVRTAKQELVSVTQRDRTPLVVGQRVLVIAGNQARIVPDYTAQPPATPAEAAAEAARPATQTSATQTPATPPAAAPDPAALPAAIPAVPPLPVVAPPPPPPAGEVSSGPGPGPVLRQALEDAAASRLPPVALPMARAMSGEAAAP
jgi:outer membrane lipoprotein SlyB